MAHRKTNRTILGTALAVVIAAACGAAPFPPEDLGGMPRIRLLEGEDAQRLVSRLHRNPSVVPEATWLAEYAAPGGTVLLYVSRFGSAREAAGALEAMLRGIRRGGSPFSDPVARPDGSWASTGLGQEHLIWASGEELFWLQAPRGALEAAWEALEDHHPVSSPVAAH